MGGVKYRESALYTCFCLHFGNHSRERGKAAVSKLSHALALYTAEYGAGWSGSTGT